MKKFVLISIFFLYQISFSQWQASNNGLTNLSVNSLGVLDGKIFAGTDSGIFISNDDGGSWTACNNGIISPKRVSSILVIGSKIFAGVNGNLYLSEDYGASWSNKSNGLSDDNREIYLDISGNKMFLGKYAIGMYSSEDNGNTWLPKNTGLKSNSIFSVAIYKNNVFCGTNAGGIFLSEDYGEYWTNVLSNNTIRAFLKLDYGIFAGSYGGGVYFSSNGGKKWYTKNEGIPNNTKVYSFSSNGDFIFAGTEKGVYVSDDKGDFWTKMSDGIPPKISMMNNNVTSFVILGENIFCGTYLSGIYKAKLSEVEDIGLDTLRLTIKDQMTSEVLSNAQVWLRYEVKDNNFTKILLHTTDSDGKVIFYPNFEQGPFQVIITLKNYKTYAENYLTYNDLKYRKEIFIGQYDDIPSYIDTLDKSINDIALTQGPITVYAENDLQQITGINAPDYLTKILNSRMFYKWLGNPMAIVLPRRDTYTFSLVPTDDGDYTFEIWKTLKDNSFKYLKYEGKVADNIITKIPGNEEPISLQRCWIVLNSDTAKNNYFLYIDLNGDNFPDDSLKPTKNITTGIEELTLLIDEGTFSIYPNPANDLLNITSQNESPLGEIRIYNIQGELVLLKNCSSLNAKINLSNFSPGIYFIRKGLELKTIIKD